MKNYIMKKTAIPIYILDYEALVEIVRPTTGSDTGEHEGQGDGNHEGHDHSSDDHDDHTDHSDHAKKRSVNSMDTSYQLMNRVSCQKLQIQYLTNTNTLPYGTKMIQAQI